MSGVRKYFHMTRILHLSDTHGRHRLLKELPEADILVHSGDFTKDGDEEEALDFMDWLCGLPYSHKVFVAGNHDLCMHGAEVEGLDSNVHFLSNSGIELEGFNIYGVPMTAIDVIEGRQRRNYAEIPSSTDVLISHEPPYGILDCDGGIHYGDIILLEKVMSISPRLHLFGHVHSTGGILRSRSVIFSNGCDGWNVIEV